MKNRFIIFIYLLLLSAIAYAQENNFDGKGELSHHTINHKGVEYEYHLYKPQNMEDNAPLVIVFHGYGANGLLAQKFGFNPVADKYGFAVCYPTGPKDFKGQNCWDVGYSFHKEKGWKRDDVGFTLKLIKYLQKEYELSMENIFVTGHSNGGEMSYLLAYRAPETFAAAAPISGLTMKWMYDKLPAGQIIPLLEIHGTEDVVSKWNGDPYNKDGWGEYIAVPVAVNVWATQNRCTHIESEELPLKRNRVIAHRYVNGINGNQVWLYEVVGGQHAWPDKDMDTAEEIWKFFSLWLK